MTTTNSGVANTGTNDDASLDSAADAFLARFTTEENIAGEDDAALNKKQPSEKTGETKPKSEEKPADEETTEETPDESPEETEEETTETEEETEEKPAKKNYVETDDVFVKVKVGDEEHEVSVKDLKRLFGQEASLTRKGQEVAEQRTKVDAEAQKYAAGLDALYKRASTKADEFRKINWMALTKDPTVNAETLSILQDEARKAFEEETFLKGELGTFVQAATQQAQAQMAETAKATVKTLGDKESPFYIEGWNKDVYTDLMSFARAEGLSKDITDNLVEAPAIKLLHMAMSYKKGLSKVTTQKVNKTAKKIIKTSSAPVATNVKSSKEKEAMKALKADGSQENAANAFLARIADNSPQD